MLAHFQGGFGVALRQDLVYTATLPADMLLKPVSGGGFVLDDQQTHPIISSTSHAVIYFNDFSMRIVADEGGNVNVQGVVARRS